MQLTNAIELKEKENALKSSRLEETAKIGLGH